MKEKLEPLTVSKYATVEVVQSKSSRDRGCSYDKVWKLDTILQEPGNCHLYEKCGFVQVGEEHIINDKMTLIDYEKR